MWGGTNPHERELLREGRPLPVNAKRNLSPGMRAKVVDMFLRGTPVSSIQRMLGTGRGTILQHLVNEVSLLRDTVVDHRLAS